MSRGPFSIHTAGLRRTTSPSGPPADCWHSLPRAHRFAPARIARHWHPLLRAARPLATPEYVPDALRLHEQEEDKITRHRGCNRQSAVHCQPPADIRKTGPMSVLLNWKPDTIFGVKLMRRTSAGVTTKSTLRFRVATRANAARRPSEAEYVSDHQNGHSSAFCKSVFTSSMEKSVRNTATTIHANGNSGRVLQYWSRSFR